MLEKIIKLYPSLTDADFYPKSGSILLQDDGDGKGAYIAKWEHTLAKPTDEELA
jgi:hypothetical protein